MGFIFATVHDFTRVINSTALGAKMSEYLHSVLAISRYAHNMQRSLYSVNGSPGIDAISTSKASPK